MIAVFKISDPFRKKGRTYTPYTRKGVYGVGEPCRISKVGCENFLTKI